MTARSNDIRILYNVANTSEDRTFSGIDWLSTIEKKLGIIFSNRENWVGAHMARNPGMSGSWNTEYIVAIHKSKNNLDNKTRIPVDMQYSIPYFEAKQM